MCFYFTVSLTELIAIPKSRKSLLFSGTFTQGEKSPVTNTNRIEDHYPKGGHGRTKDDPSNMQIAGSMLRTVFRKIRSLLLSLMIAPLPLAEGLTSIEMIISFVILAIYMVITMYRVVHGRHEFAHIARRMALYVNKTSSRFSVAIAYAVLLVIYGLLIPGVVYCVAFGFIVPSTPNTFSDAPAWIMCVSLLLIAVASFITSIMDDFIDGILTDFYDEDNADSPDSPAEDIATRPVESATTSALAGFAVGYICGRFNR